MSIANRTSAAQDKPDGKKQIHMIIDGSTVKLNISTNKGEVARIETVKRMMLNGLAKV